MRQPILAFTLLLSAFHCLAQTDSAGYLDIYRNETQQLLMPALAADMGKHILRTDFKFRQTPSNTLLLKYWQAAYQTQWRNHGFGLVFRNVPSSQLLSEQTVGLQYAYGIGLGKNSFWKNSKLSMGVEVAMTKGQPADKLIFLDQLSPYGQINQSAEPAPGNVLYPEVKASFSFRSYKYYLTTTFSDLNAPRNGLYSTNFRKEMTVDIQTGVKFIEWKKMAIWGVYDLPLHDSHLSLTGIGLAGSFHHIIVTWKNRGVGKGDPNNLFQLSYFTPRMRCYVQYDKTYYPYSAFLYGGTFSTGLAIGLTKQ
jgi:hypothetical protein